MAPLRPEAPALPQHTWAKAVAAVSSPHPDGPTIAAGIQHWQQHGIPAISLEHLEALGQPGLPSHDPSSGDGELLPATLQLQVLGSSAEQWPLHLWLAQLPLGAGSNVHISGEQPADAALHLQALALTAADPQLLQQLQRLPRVFDPKPEQVRLLRLLGVNAEHLAAAPGGPPGNSWLEQPGDTEAASAALGLPNPTYLLRVGSPGLLALGCSGHPGWLHPPGGLQQLPCFPPAPALSAEQARLLASWLLHCRRAGLQLVRLNPTPAEQELGVWQTLQIPTFVDPIAPEELLEELAWRQAGCPAPTAVHTPRPEAQLLWSHNSGTPAQAAICISSYNYADRIEAALESCLRQSLQALELVVVDDASSDASLATIQRWLEQHGSRFCRGLLLRHTSNGGLAAARNTAFTAAQAPWCFVLDADNTLEPQALDRCLALALASPASTAVVHPLIRCVDAAGPSSLVGGGHAWQLEQFLAGNMVDAMALIRRSAWQAVEGYSHIPGGWEDFDFWCKLITAQRHGVLCPEVLATYHRHGDSMLQSHTNRRQRQLSRLLQHRHPWLQLQLAQPEA
jgi:GT2 family glycosyltransferase